MFAAGRIINPGTARSQLLGGMTMGLSMALHEQSVLDPRFGHVINHDLANYHVTAHADVGVMEAEWIDEEDPYVNPMPVWPHREHTIPSGASRPGPARPCRGRRTAPPLRLAAR